MEGLSGPSSSGMWMIGLWALRLKAYKVHGLGYLRRHTGEFQKNRNLRIPCTGSLNVYSGQESTQGQGDLVSRISAGFKLGQLHLGISLHITYFLSPLGSK